MNGWILMVNEWVNIPFVPMDAMRWVFVLQSLKSCWVIIESKLPWRQWWRRRKTLRPIWVFPKIRGKTPKMDGLSWKTLLKWIIWGVPHFRKHPYNLDSNFHDATLRRFFFVCLLRLVGDDFRKIHGKSTIFHHHLREQFFTCFFQPPQAKLSDSYMICFLCYLPNLVQLSVLFLLVPKCVPRSHLAFCFWISCRRWGLHWCAATGRLFAGPSWRFRMFFCVENSLSSSHRAKYGASSCS